MRPLLRSWSRLLLVGVTLVSSGCATRLLHRGGPAVVTTPVTAEGSSKKSRKPRAEKVRVEKARPEKVIAERAHAEKHSVAEFSGDPLAEARARAEQNPSEPWWPTRAAQLEAASGRTAAAESSLRTALERDSAYAPALTRLSRLYYEQGRHEDAVRLLAPLRDRRVSLRSADRAAALSGLALHEAALGREDEAQAVMAMLSRDEREDAAGVAGYLALRGGSADSAAKLTEAAVKAAPASAANHNNRGIALLRSADPDGAAREFERAIALDPTLPGPYYNLAILERWYRLDHAAAAKRFQQYWTRSHADPDSLYAELGRGSPAPVAEEGPNR